MTSLTKKPNWTLAIGFPLLVMITCTILVFSPVFSLKPDSLSTAVTLDLTLTAPLLYFLVIRGTKVPKMTVVRVFIVGLALAGFLLHDKPHFLLGLLKTWLAPVAEGLVIFLLAKKLYRARRTAATLHEDTDFLVRSRIILSEMTGNEKAGHVLASEMAVLYYAFLPQKKRLPGAFTAYKTNGILLILGVFLCMFFVETLGLHLLIGLWSKKLAWVLTTLGLYTALQLYAHMRAIRSRPILLGDQFLHLRNGLAADVSVQIDNIEQIELDTNRMQVPNRMQIPANKTTPQPSRPNASPAEPSTVKLALIKGLENHNIRLRLKQPLLVNRVFGLQKKADSLLFFVDQPEDFLAAIRLKMGE